MIEILIPILVFVTVLAIGAAVGIGLRLRRSAITARLLEFSKHTCDGGREKKEPAWSTTGSTTSTPIVAAGSTWTIDRPGLHSPEVVVGPTSGPQGLPLVGASGSRPERFAGRITGSDVVPGDCR